MDGAEALRHLRNDPNPKIGQIPVIMLTGYGENEVACLEAGADDFVIKPIKPEVLRARIAKKASREETQISLAYIEEVARAYEHFFFRYAASDLLVINTSEIDFVERSADLQQLLRRLQDPVKGTQYFLPLGPF